MREPEFYIKQGFEDMGYISPELSSDNTYPDYIHEEVLRCAEQISRYQNAETVTIAFMTDIHYAMNDNQRVRMERTLNAYKEIAARVHIDKLVLGGDYTNEGCKPYKSECFRELRAHFRGLTYYPVHGNHDDGTTWDNAYIKAPKSTNHLTHDDLYKLFYNHLPSAGACMSSQKDALYYYCDDNRTKLRCIFLDSEDVAYIYDDNGKLLYGGQHSFTLSQKQIDWLVNEALRFDEDGWSVLLFTHSLAHPDRTDEELTFERMHMSVFNDLLDDYRRGAAICRDYYDGDFKIHLEADFANRIRAEVIGAFVGDYHRDDVWRTKTGIPYILTGNCVMYCKSKRNVPRRDGDKTELLFDIATVDRKKRKIYVTRVGAGDDRVVTFDIEE